MPMIMTAIAKKQRLQKISKFLQESDQKQLVLNIRNFWSTALTLGAFGSSIALFLKSKSRFTPDKGRSKATADRVV